MRFAPAPEYPVFPTRERPLKPYEAVLRATAATRPLVAELAPDAVVADILTLAPALAAELEGVPVATVIPHLDPRTERGWPPFSLGARRPRTAVGRGLWSGLSRLTDAGGGPSPDRLAGRLAARLEFADFDEVAQAGASAYLGAIVQDCAGIHEAVYEAFVAYPLEHRLPA